MLFAAMVNVHVPLNIQRVILIHTVVNLSVQIIMIVNRRSLACKTNV